MSKQWLLEQRDFRPVMTSWQKADFHDWCKKNPTAKFYLTPIESTRTMPQNRLYWLYLGVIARETGDEADNLHEFFKQEFLIPEVLTVMGREVKKYPSTTKLKKQEFSDYMEKICALTEIPIPDTERFNNFMETAPLINEEYK